MQTLIYWTLTGILFLTSISLRANDSTKIAAVLAQYQQQTGFSGTVLVAENGQSIYQESFGLAYYPTPDTIKNHYRYSIASVTKLFTCIRILQLVEKKQVDLFQPIVHYLPALEGLISDSVGAHHLLLHISGLPEEKLRFYARMEPISSLVRQVLANNKPGTFGQFNYNNIDYLVLGLLIEAVTGQSWQQNISQHILAPCRLGDTGFLSYGEYPEDFAYPHSQKRKQLRQDAFFQIENFYAAGCMYSTAADLLRLDQALYTDVLLKPESLELLGKSFPEYNYAGYSVWNYRYPFVEAQPLIMERRGGIQGANVVLVRMPEYRYTIIILSNDDRFNPDSFGDDNNLREALIRALF